MKTGLLLVVRVGASTSNRRGGGRVARQFGATAVRVPATGCIAAYTAVSSRSRAVAQIAPHADDHTVFAPTRATYPLPGPDGDGVLDWHRVLLTQIAHKGRQAHKRWTKVSRQRADDASEELKTEDNQLSGTVEGVAWALKQTISKFDQNTARTEPDGADGLAARLLWGVHPYDISERLRDVLIEADDDERHPPRGHSCRSWTTAVCAELGFDQHVADVYGLTADEAAHVRRRLGI